MKNFEYRRFFRSFSYALRGLRRLIRDEQNAQVHATAALVVAFSAYAFRLSSLEVAILLFAIGLVFAIEITNTAIEKLLDVVHPERHDQIAYVKDALAGAVLIAAAIALAVGVLVFLPHVLALL